MISNNTTNDLPIECHVNTPLGGYFPCQAIFDAGCRAASISNSRSARSSNLIPFPLRLRPLPAAKNRSYRFNIQGDCYSVTNQQFTRFESLTPYQIPVLPIHGSRRSGASRKSGGGALSCLSSKDPHRARCKRCTSPDSAFVSATRPVPTSSGTRLDGPVLHGFSWYVDRRVEPLLHHRRTICRRRLCRLGAGARLCADFRVDQQGLGSTPSRSFAVSGGFRFRPAGHAGYSGRRASCCDGLRASRYGLAPTCLGWDGTGRVSPFLHKHLRTSLNTAEVQRLRDLGRP